MEQLIFRYRGTDFKEGDVILYQNELWKIKAIADASTEYIAYIERKETTGYLWWKKTKVFSDTIYSVKRTYKKK
jgi:hypothetical protein